MSEYIHAGFVHILKTLEFQDVRFQGLESILEIAGVPGEKP